MIKRMALDHGVLAVREGRAEVYLGIQH
jgi:hypothetical protein